MSDKIRAAALRFYDRTEQELAYWFSAEEAREVDKLEKFLIEFLDEMKKPSNN